jgi:hypothetical protein
MSTYLRHQCLYLQLSEPAANAHSWSEAEWHCHERVSPLAVLRVSFQPPLGDEFIRFWVIFVHFTHHQQGHKDAGL